MASSGCGHNPGHSSCRPRICHSTGMCSTPCCRSDMLMIQFANIRIWGSTGQPACVVMTKACAKYHSGMRSSLASAGCWNPTGCKLSILNSQLSSLLSGWRGCAAKCSTRQLIQRTYAGAEHHRLEPSIPFKCRAQQINVVHVLLWWHGALAAA